MSSDAQIPQNDRPTTGRSDAPRSTLLWTAATTRPLDEVASLVSLLKQSELERADAEDDAAGVDETGRSERAPSPGDEALRAAAVSRPVDDVHQLVTLLNEAPDADDEAHTALCAAAVGRSIEDVAQLISTFGQEELLSPAAEGADPAGAVADGADPAGASAAGAAHAGLAGSGAGLRTAPGAAHVNLVDPDALAEGRPAGGPGARGALTPAASADIRSSGPGTTAAAAGSAGAGQSASGRPVSGRSAGSAQPTAGQAAAGRATAGQAASRTSPTRKDAARKDAARKDAARKDAARAAADKRGADRTRTAPATLRSTLRWPAAGSLFVLGAIHLPVHSPGGLRAGEYASGASLVAAVLCLVLALLLAVQDTVWVWAVSAAVAVGTLVMHSLAAAFSSVDLLRNSLGHAFQGALAAAVVCAVAAVVLAGSALIRRQKAPVTANDA